MDAQDATRPFPKASQDVNDDVNRARLALRSALERSVTGMLLRDAARVGARISVCLELIEGTLSVEANTITLTSTPREPKE